MSLSYNRLSDTNLQYLAAAIMSNTVRQKYFLCLSYIYIYRLLQTLTTLTLTTNEVGDRGLQFLANAIQNNKVDIIFYKFIFIT
jgi:hypothetical protein